LGRPLVPDIGAGWGEVLAAGFVVGLGTRYAGGCTSGHGVCGLSRGSLRSLVATATFMAAGVLTVFVQRHVLGG
ncbi:YeeE/YedE family protein, partial [Ralstonia pseudosolanacearum]